MSRTIHPATVYFADEQAESLPDLDIPALVLHVLDHEHMPARTEVTVLLVDEPSIAEYNQRFMGKEGPTDVLSFPLEEFVPGEEVAEPAPSDPPINVGDVVIAPSYVRRQAVDFEVEFGDELALMVVHGMLHLLGWDHETDEEAELMEAREAAILARVGRKRR